MIFKKLDELESKYKQLAQKLQQSALQKFSKEQAEFLKEFSSLEKIVKLYQQYKEIEKNIQFHQNIVNENTEDKDFIDLAKEELKSLQKKQALLVTHLKQVLIPKDPLDEKNIIIEIRAAAGGDESALFCRDLFNMYSHYAEKRNWKVEILSLSRNDVGGMKEVIFSVDGSDVYSNLKYESGVHRVQRVPNTESQGRIHTSTVTIVVLPSVDKVDIKVNSSDVRIDVFRSSGSGGQHVNTTDSAVRVVHLPTKITVQCQDEKSQHANKEKAMKILYARLYDLQMEKRKKEESQKRLSQIGTGDRSEKVRTYNFPQSRVTDHRINLTLYNLDQVMKGELEELVHSLKVQATEEYYRIEREPQ